MFSKSKMMFQSSASLFGKNTIQKCPASFNTFQSRCELIITYFKLGLCFRLQRTQRFGNKTLAGVLESKIVYYQQDYSLSSKIY